MNKFLPALIMAASSSMWAQSQETWLSGGVSVLANGSIGDFVPPGAAAISGSSVRPGGNVGAGFKVRLSPLFGFRFDIREYITAKPNRSGLLFNQGGPLSQTEFSASFGVYF